MISKYAVLVALGLAAAGAAVGCSASPKANRGLEQRVQQEDERETVLSRQVMPEVELNLDNTDHIDTPAPKAEPCAINFIDAIKDPLKIIEGTGTIYQADNFDFDTARMKQLVELAAKGNREEIFLVCKTADGNVYWVDVGHKQKIDSALGKVDSCLLDQIEAAYTVQSHPMARYIQDNYRERWMEFLKKNIPEGSVIAPYQIDIS